MTARFDFAPLEQLVDPDGNGPAYVASALGVSPHSIHRMRSEGLSPAQADRYAVRAGVHPGEIWPSWWCPYSALAWVLQADLERARRSRHTTAANEARRAA